MPTIGGVPQNVMEWSLKEMMHDTVWEALPLDDTVIPSLKVIRTVPEEMSYRMWRWLCVFEKQGL